ncbi:MAG: NAD(P)/FAD-dependent oxidoreductase [Phycisphaerales bacterium]|nr:NAD(P)/FAD-dependent oxidoreductase [Phycisphaerales bacterium]
MRTSSSSITLPDAVDVIIAGAGHNGLVCAAILAGQGKKVLVCEASDAVGGACRTERPFAKAPGVGCSTGAYLLGPMPPEVLDATGLRSKVRLIPRRPHGFFLLPQSDIQSEARAQARAPLASGTAVRAHTPDMPGLAPAPLMRPVAFGIPGGLTHLAPQDRAALDDLDVVLAAIRDDLAPLWLQDAIPLEESIDFIRNTPAPSRVGGTIRDLYRLLALGASGDAYPSGALRDFLECFSFASEFVKAVVATDGFVGSSRGYADPGSGMNFLLHNMLRLPAGDGPTTAQPLGSWQLVEGGMGAITRGLAECVQDAGGLILTGARVTEAHPGPSSMRAVEIEGVGSVRARALVIATDPRSALDMLSGEARMRLEQVIAPIGDHLGTSLKINLALKRLPSVVGTRELQAIAPSAHPLAGTVHILPTVDTMARLERARRRATIDGHVPDAFDAMIDVYTHTAVDPSLMDAQGRHAMSLFVQWVPSTLSALAAEEFAHSLIDGPVAQVLPDLPELIEDMLVLAPRGIEGRFGIRGGHIHHVDNGWTMNRRLPARSPIQGIYLAGAGAHPGGSVVGAAGLIAAKLILSDFPAFASADTRPA